MSSLSRRAFGLAGLGGTSLALAGCAEMRDMPVFGTLFADWPREAKGPVETPDYGRIYGRLEGERHPVPAFDYTNLDPGVLRADVPYGGPEGAGTIVVDPAKHLLYLVAGNGRATRYGIAVGPESRGFSGQAVIGERRIWPDPSALPAIASTRFLGVWAQLTSAPAARAPTGGPKSPRGARALYLASLGASTGYVIHGTANPETVGTDVRTGCIGLINQDVVDLYDRSPERARVVVLG